MIRVYPIVLTKVKIDSEDGYAVYVPDLEINTQGYNLANAIYMARDAIGAKGICEEDEGRTIPEPSTSEPLHEVGDLISWIDIDFAKYRRANDMTTMRINVSVPKYLKVLGEDAGVNFSHELQERLKERLHVQ
jgi:predicted RNase H-like HicB family nuclease